MRLFIDKIRMDGGTQPRATIDDTTVREYAEAMQANAVFPSPVVFYDGKDYWLADGFHRVGAAHFAGKQSIDCEIKQGTVRDAKLYSVGANASHGLRRTNADKRRAVMTLLDDAEWSGWSDREIARRCGVSQPFVSDLRPTLTDNGYQSESRTYTTKHGSTSVMKTSNIGKSKIPADYSYECETCGDYFPAPVKECPNCRHHYSSDSSQCTNCHQSMNGDERKSAPAPVQITKPAPYITVAEWEAMSERQRGAVLHAPRPQSFHMNQTNDNVEWAMWTWNPVTGCLHNCSYCYARDIANRFYKQGFEPVFHPERLDGPKNTRVPERATTEIGYGNVFTCSMADLFGKWVPQGWIDATLQVMREQAQWTYLVLTKFPQRLSEQDWPENTWVGASIDRQARVKETLKSFDKVKSNSNAGVTWLSLEPLLEPLKFDSLEMFDMVVVGGASASSQTPEWTPPSGWIADIMAQADRDGAAVYLKTNGRPREYPGYKPLYDTKAPAEFGVIGADQ